MLSLVLFGCCMVCHGELVRLKPQPALLTRFYLLVSAGGAAGGIFVVLIAPQIFTGFWEFHFGLIACVVVAILALIRDRSSWWHNAQPYLGMIMLLGLALVPDFLSRYITLAVVPEMMYRAHYYPILTALALVTAVVFFTTRNKPHKARRFNLAQLAAVAVLAALCAALYICVAFDKSREIRRDRNFYSALQIQKITGIEFSGIASRPDIARVSIAAAAQGANSLFRSDKRNRPSVGSRWLFTTVSSTYRHHRTWRRDPGCLWPFG